MTTCRRGMPPNTRLLRKHGLALLSARGIPAVRRREVELHIALAVHVDLDPATIDELAEQQFVGQRTADRVLDQARHRAGAHHRIETLLGQVRPQRIGEDDVDLLLVQLVLKLHQELVDDAQHHLFVERLERDDRVEPVAELRREHALDVGHLVAGLTRV